MFHIHSPVSATISLLLLVCILVQLECSFHFTTSFLFLNLLKLLFRRTSRNISRFEFHEIFQVPFHLECCCGPKFISFSLLFYADRGAIVLYFLFDFVSRLNDFVNDRMTESMIN